MSKQTSISEPVFAWPGNKRSSLGLLVDILPIRDVYIEPFGGTGIVLLNRRKSPKLEVFNDINPGIVTFYKVIKDPEKCAQLIELLETSIYSRVLFEEYRDFWRQEKDPVAKAYKWYYMVRCSFGGMGRNFGRSLKKNSDTHKLYRCIPAFQDIQDRLRDVYIECRSAFDMLKEYDSPETVFYLDPPYLDCGQGAYKDTLKFEQHLDLLKLCMSLKGYVALSGYDNEYYDMFKWSNKIDWEVAARIKGMAMSEGGHNKDITDDKRPKAKEVLWIKEPA